MRLFKYMQGEFRKIDLRFNKMEKNIDSVLKAVDAVLKQNEAYTQEMLVMNSQVERHERWISKVSKAAKT